jgi:hypothetical protein
MACIFYTWVQLVFFEATRGRRKWKTGQKEVA